jgi:hypothetical protein
MDNSQDNLSVVSEVDAIGAGLKNIAKGIRDKAKAKKAQKISDSGGYLTLTPYQKSLIDVPDYILNQGIGATDAEIKNLPAVTDWSQKLPLIIGAVIVLVLLYIVVRKK